jgi:hypothetical protein
MEYIQDHGKTYAYQLDCHSYMYASPRIWLRKMLINNVTTTPAAVWSSVDLFQLF